MVAEEMIRERTNINCYGGTIEEKFWSSVVKSAGCWMWDGPRKNACGRSRPCLSIGCGPHRRRPLAHRVSFEMHVRALADDEDVIQTCLSRDCCNPEHLMAVKRKVGSWK
jgi:hypothetical protein